MELSALESVEHQFRKSSGEVTGLQHPLCLGEPQQLAGLVCWCGSALTLAYDEFQARCLWLTRSGGCGRDRLDL